MNIALAYLYGLIAGRGHLSPNSFLIAIEFAHTNEFVEGIAHCQKCGYLATKPKKTDGENLVCKNLSCMSKVSPDVKKKYNQPVETVASLEKTIIPFLKSGINADYEISSNKTCTLLLIDFKNSENIFKSILSDFAPNQSFDTFEIPTAINNASTQEKIEFINGLLDTSGFANAGGWLNRDGKFNHGRMRAYFQIVRNWKMPVQIDNFLRKNFQLSTHTIDWGHPNIRDGNLSEVYGDEKSSSWSREHQVKFFPEYFGIFRFRISSKEKLFNELLTHNKKAQFNSNEDWFPPSPFSITKVKPTHPGENDFRIPLAARRHFDAFWQINLAMGCKYLETYQNKCKNPDIFALNGNSEGNYTVTKKQFEIKSKELHDKIFSDYQIKKSKAIKERNNTPVRKRTNPEAETYPLLINFFEKYFEDKYKQEILIFDTSSSNLNQFLKRNNSDLFESVEYCEQFRIRPDVVAYLSSKKRLIFIESKVTPLDFSALGQLLGYCLVAKPIEAILISTQDPAPSFIRTLKVNKDILKYDSNSYIQIATLRHTGKVNFQVI